jgi:hypothetical protein
MVHFNGNGKSLNRRTSVIIMGLYMVITIYTGYPEKSTLYRNLSYCCSAQDFMRLVIKNSIQLCLRTLVFSSCVQHRAQAFKL